MTKMEKEELEKKCNDLEKIIKDIWWMARRYAHGRQSYAVEQYNSAIKKAQSLGIDIKPDPVDNIIEAKDSMFDKDWFEARNLSSVKFITEEK